MNHIGDLFIWCNDIENMRNFYSNTLGLEEGWTGEEEGEDSYDFLGYTMNNSLRLHFLAGTGSIDIHKSWARQPAHHLGNSEIPSWTISLNEKEFQKVVKNVVKAELPILQNAPVWKDGYWGFTVQDPMGYSVFLYWETSEEPDNKIWKV